MVLLTRPRGPEVVRFDGVEGPSAPTVVSEIAPATWQAFRDGGPHRLAILLTDTTSSWLGLAHGLRSIGIPFRITLDHEEALQHDVVVVYPRISGRLMTGEALRALSRHPRAGGTLIGVNVEGGGLASLFGFTEAVTSRERSEVVFDTTRELASDFTHERERRIPFSNPRRGDRAAGSVGYLGASAPLATFDDGTAAITMNSIGDGRAYAFGIDPGFLLLRAYGNRQEGLSREYVNGYEPALDVLLRLLRRIYREGQPDGVTLHTVPDGRSLSALITHDVDYEESLPNSEEYARHERSVNVPATYFVQTKYVRDWNDEAFLNPEGVTVLRRLLDMGMEIASHSVAHSLQFDLMPFGTGDEAYPAYQPAVESETSTAGGTVLGELRVSRYLLETLVPGAEVRSFRPGHLKNPYALPQALAATGYLYSSSVTAGSAMTHLPFRLAEDRGADASVSVFEFPVTIEDEAEPSLPARLNDAIELARQLERYGGLFVVLMHTDEVGEKLAFQGALIDAIQDRAWFGTVADFGAFWSARDQVELDVTRAAGGGLRVELSAPEAIDGLTLIVPSGYRVTASVPAELVRAEGPGSLVLNGVQGRAEVTLRR